MTIRDTTTLMYSSAVPEIPRVDREMPIHRARNHLGEVLAAVRYFGAMTFLTNRGHRVAAIVPAEVGEMVDRLGTAQAAAVLNAAERAGGASRALEILSAHTSAPES